MDFEEKKKKAQEHANRVKEKQELHQIKHANDAERKLPTHKLITFYLFVLLNVILIYALIAMWYFGDLTHLGVVVTDIAAQVITFFIYSHHSTAQNTVGGIVYDKAMYEIKHQFHLEDEMSQEEIDNAVG